MKIGILSRASHSYSTRRLVEAAKSAQHQVIVLDPFRFSLHIDLPTCYQRQLRFRPDQAKQQKSTGVGRTSERHNIDCLHILYDGKPIFDLDLIIPRLSSTTVTFATEVLLHFQSIGVPLLNRSQEILVARHKFRSLRRLVENDIPVIPSFTTGSPDFLDASVNEIGDYPILMKPFQGTHGRGFMLIDTPLSLHSSVEAMCEFHQDYMMQPFIGRASGQDIRIIVAGGRVVAAMKRTAASGEYRANVHRGGQGQPINISNQLSDLAVRATKALELDVAGVDLLETHNMIADAEYVVLEVNPSPGLEEIEAVTKINVAEAIITYAETIGDR